MDVASARLDQAFSLEPWTYDQFLLATRGLGDIQDPPHHGGAKVVELGHFKTKNGAVAWWHHGGTFEFWTDLYVQFVSAIFSHNLPISAVNSTSKTQSGAMEKAGKGSCSYNGGQSPVGCIQIWKHQNSMV